MTYTLPLYGMARRSFLRGTAGTLVGASSACVLSPSVAAGRVADSCPRVALPMKDVAGKVAFITGGSSGIGLGIARACFDAGMKVALAYRTREHLEEAMKYFDGGLERVHAIEVDVTDRVAVQSAAAEVAKVFGKVHLLVNNAGVNLEGPLSEATHKDWDWVMSVNLGGVFNCVTAVLPYLHAHGEGGQIVTTASTWGLLAVNDAAIYCASKAAVIMMMESLRGELLPSNIGVSVFCPGAVFSRGWVSDRNRPPELVDDKEVIDANKLLKGEAIREKLRDAGAMMDPLEAGRMVLQGIRNNHLYILSHPEYEQGIRERSEALLASIPTNVKIPEARVNIERSTMRNATYVVERDRRRCAGRTGG